MVGKQKSEKLTYVRDLEPLQKPDVAIHSFSPSPGRQRQMEPLAGELQFSWETLFQNLRWKAIEEDIRVAIWPPPKCAQYSGSHACTHICTHKQNLALATCDHIWPFITVAGPKFEFIFVIWSYLLFNKCGHLYLIIASLDINCTSRKVSVLKRQTAIVQKKEQLISCAAWGSRATWVMAEWDAITILQGSLGMPSLRSQSNLFYYQLKNK